MLRYEVQKVSRKQVGAGANGTISRQHYTRLLLPLLTSGICSDESRSLLVAEKSVIMNYIQWDGYGVLVRRWSKTQNVLVRDSILSKVERDFIE